MNQIFGTTFADTLSGTPDDDVILGFQGDDHLYGQDGNDMLFGDAGKDVLDDWRGTDLFSGGDGNDTLLLHAGSYDNALASATGVDEAQGGAGHDLINVRGVGLGHVLSGGSGSDFFAFSAAPGILAPSTLATFTITDFSLADEDRLIPTPGIAPYAWRGVAPAGFTASEGERISMFSSGLAEIWTFSQGSDAVVWIDVNANAVVDTLDLRILLVGQAPLGPEAYGPGVLAVLQGTPGDDVVDGSPLDDMIFGEGGNDFIRGGDGIDVITTLDGDDTLLGGNGRDQLTAGAGRNLVDGGAGDDYLVLDGTAGSHTDALGGSGQDTFALHPGGGTATVFDFQPGPGGDLLDVHALLTADGLPFPSTLNPFEPWAGYLRLLANPDSTELQWDRNGAMDGGQWETVATLQGVQAFALTPGNFDSPGDITQLLIAPGNRPPTVWQPVPDLWVDEDSPVGFVPSATTFDDNGPLFELTITATLADGSPLPAWLNFTGGLGTYQGVPGIGWFTGTPTNDDVGTVEVRLTATDVQGAQVSDDFLLVVRNVNDAPVVTQVPPPIVAQAGTFLDWTLPAGTFTDVDAGDQLHLDVWAERLWPLLLPSWLQFDAASGHLSGMPGRMDEGTITLHFNAVDLGGALVSVDVPLTVEVLDTPPTVAQPVPDLWIDEDSPVGFVLPATTFADDAPLFELTITATLTDGSPLPSWLGFTGGLGTYQGVPGIGWFAGTPTNDDVGTIGVRLTATDVQGAQASDDFLVVVRNTNDAPVVAQVPQPIVAQAGTFLDWTLPSGTFVDVDAGDVLHLSARVEPLWPQLLPAWLQFDAVSGHLFGMPGPMDAGTVTLRFDALDLGGAIASVDVPLTVEVLNRPPVAGDDLASTRAGTPVVVAVLANDTDPDTGQTLKVDSLVAPAVGSVALNPDGSVIYAPLGQWNGQDSFAYTLSDGLGGTAMASVTVDVLPSIAGTDAANKLGGTNGPDSIDAKGGNDNVTAGAGDDFVRGGQGDDTVAGGSGNDVLLGEAGNDVLQGQAGGDTLAGGPGVDRVYTGTGNGRADGSPDLVVFDTAPNASNNVDTVYGFEANGMDRFVLSPAVFAVLLGGATPAVDSGEFRAGTNVQALDADDHLLFDTRNAMLYFDVDGNGPQPSVPVASLPGLVGTLDASDFTLVVPPGL